MDNKLIQAFNKQINHEFYSAYLYFAMSTYFDEIMMRGFSGLAKNRAKEKLKPPCTSRLSLFTWRNLYLAVINLLLTHRRNMWLIDTCHYPIQLKVSHDLWLFVSCALLRCAQVKPRFFFILCYSDINSSWDNADENTSDTLIQSDSGSAIFEKVSFSSLKIK